jgi:hypothetical protein
VQLPWQCVVQVGIVVLCILHHGFRGVCSASERCVQLVLAAYMIANAFSDSVGQGFITVALAVIGFIFKKILLQMADPINLETAMLVAGLWVENLGDVFVTLAFPTAHKPGPTFAIIWLARVAENLAYLWFQLNIWFKFRIWIKGKFKPDQVRPGHDVAQRTMRSVRAVLRIHSWLAHDACNQITPHRTIL